MNYRCLLFLFCLCIPGADGPGAQPQPQPQPQQRPASLLYVSPLPGAALVSRETNVIVRFDGSAADYITDPASMFSAVGSVSGRLTGAMVVADDAETILFEPDTPFKPGEDVAITVRYRSPDAGVESYRFEFTVSPRRTGPEEPDAREFMESHGITPPRRTGSGAPVRSAPQTGNFVPPADYPTFDIGPVDNPGDGYVFFTSYVWKNDPPPSFLMILRNDGTPVFFQKSTSFVLDFKKQNDKLLSFYEFGTGAFIIMDSTYTRVDLCRCGNGYGVDSHEFQILDNGHHLIICKDLQYVDMSEVFPGGSDEAQVTGMIYQEIDQSKNVVFEWRSWDHFEITDAIGVDFTSDRIDYVHSNALVTDHDGNWLVSSRHLCEITKINRTTGEIMWRWGGKNNQFRFVGDIDDTTGFYYQHDIRRLDNGNYMLYDNGNFHNPPYSRAVEYTLDTVAMTATLVWQYRDAPDVYADFMGASQRLPGGNTFIAWGASTFGPITTLTEVHPDGTKAFELTLTNQTTNYKGYRFPWSGSAPEPYLWEGPFDRESRALTLGFDKFGDRGVALYEIYAGEEFRSLLLVDSTTANTADVPGLRRGENYRFRVRAVDGQSNRSPWSNEITYRYDNTEPSEAVLIGPPDGAVVESAGVELSWTRAIDDEGDALMYSVYIIDGSGVSAIDGIEDTSYVYTRSGAAPLREFRWTVSCSDQEFTTASPDTFCVHSARAGFGVPATPSLHQNYPNPFNPATTIRYDLTQDGPVSLKIYNVLGQEVTTLIDDPRPAGFWSVEWDGRDTAGNSVASGVYIYRLETSGFSESRKLVIVR